MTTDYREAAGLNPNALSLADAARLLARVGGQAVSVEMLQADVGLARPRTRTARSTWSTMPPGF
jgi:hypothetical protein